MRNWIAVFLFAFPLMAVRAQNSEGLQVPVVYKSDCFYKKEKLYIPPKFLNILSFHENLAPVTILDTLGLRREEKTGFVNTSGQMVIPALYDHIFSHFHKGAAMVGVNSESEGEIDKGLIDKGNQVLVPLIFEEIGDSKGNFVLVRDRIGRWGFYNAALQKLYTPAFESIRFFKKDFFLVTLKGKRGLINHEGKEILSTDYKEILAKKDGSLEVRNFNRFHTIDFQGKTTSEMECDSLLPQQKGVYIYSLNEKYGVIADTHVVSPQYDFISSFHFGKAIVKQNKKYGLIDTSGHTLLPCIYDKIETDTFGLIYLKGTSAKQFGAFFIREKNRSWAVMDKYLRVVLPFQYREVGKMGDSTFAVMNNEGLWGYVNYYQKTIVPFQYHFAKMFRNGFAEVGIQQPYKKIFFFINKNGETAVTPENYHVYAAGVGLPDSSGKIHFNYPFNSFHKFSSLSPTAAKVKYGYKYGVANKAGDLIVSIDYDSILYSPDQDCFIVYLNKMPGIFSASGDTVHPLTDKYDRIYLFKEAYARVSKDGKYGCIDYNKNRRISIQYSQLQDFQEGFAGAIINGKWGFLDKNERIRVQPYYSEVKPFQHGIARVKTGQYWDFVTSEGKIVNSSLYQAIEQAAADKWLLTYNGKKGMADSSGREMLVPRYTNAVDLGAGYLQVWREGKTGVLNYDQNFVLPIEYDHLSYDAVNNNFIISEKGNLKKMKIENNSRSK